MVIFDSHERGTPAATWTADARWADREPLDLAHVDRLTVVAAHPDDETLGAGSLMARCTVLGIPVTVVMVTDGAAGGFAGTEDLASLRSAELRAALAELAPMAQIVELGFADGRSDEQRAEIRQALNPLLGGLSARDLVAAPWRGDGHVDHRVVGELVAELVPLGQLLEYPIWMWHWATPDSPDTPWSELRSLMIDGAAKARALDSFISQTTGPDPVLRPDMLAHFVSDREFFVKTDTLPPSYFDESYAHSDDPWGFESRWYEARKRLVTLATLPEEHYGRALELGCSNGVLSEALVDRCDDLLAVDVSQAAVELAESRLGDRARVERVDLGADFPHGEFDLIVFSEVGYYFSVEKLGLLLDRIEGALAQDGTVVACHWRHPVDDYPLRGDDVHRRIKARGWPMLVQHVEEDFVLEVFSRDRRSVAERTGLR